MFEFLDELLMSVGNTNVGDIGAGDVVPPWAFFKVINANPVLLDLGIEQNFV